MKIEKTSSCWLGQWTGLLLQEVMTMMPVEHRKEEQLVKETNGRKEGKDKSISLMLDFQSSIHPSFVWVVWDAVRQWEQSISQVWGP